MKARKNPSALVTGCIKESMDFKFVLATALLALVPLSTSPPARASESATNPDKIVAASVRAEGGPKRLANLRTVEYQGTLTSSDGKTTGTYSLIIEQPNRLYQEITVGNQTTRQAYNGKSAWIEDGAGVRTLTGDAGAALEAAAHYRNDRLVHYRKEKVRLLALGDESVRGHAAERLEVTTPAGIKRQVAIDNASHLVLEELIPATGSGSGHDAAKGDDRIFYDDYRAVDAIPEPYRIEFVAPDHDWIVTMTRVVHNPPVNDAVFAFPSKVGRPLPDIAALLHSVDDHQKAIDKLVEQYTCDKSSEEFEVDKHGALKPGDTEEDQVFYLDGDEVDRVMKKNGKPLSAAEEQKQDEHIQKVIQRHEKREARKEKDGDEPKKDKNDLTVSDFLRIDRFTNPRWETFRGHEVVVFDFEPNPGYKPASVVEHFIHELSGAVWIEPEDQDVVRLEAYLNGSFKMAGGLFASVQKGSAVVFEQTKINNEVWMPSYLEAHFNAKVLLLKGFSGNFVQRYSNYQKFRVETVTRAVTHQIVPPAPKQAN